MSVSREELLFFLNDYLELPKFPHDYCPNGLQVEGKKSLHKIAFSVSTTLESTHAAKLFAADALVVHHGLIWKHTGAKSITGPFYQRIQNLIKNDINLLAYHLPLDAHMDCGNAAALAREIGLEGLEPFGEYKKMPLGVKGHFVTPLKGSQLAAKLKNILGREIFHASPADGKSVESLGIITGGASHEWTFAVESNLSAYLTGEMSEYDWHDSREAGVHMFAGGHHATEKFGIQNLMQKIKGTFPTLEVAFFDSSNPA